MGTRRGHNVHPLGYYDKVVGTVSDVYAALALLRELYISHLFFVCQVRWCVGVSRDEFRTFLC